MDTELGSKEKINATCVDALLDFLYDHVGILRISRLLCFDGLDGHQVKIKRNISTELNQINTIHVSEANFEKLLLLLKRRKQSCPRNI